MGTVNGSHLWIKFRPKGMSLQFLVFFVKLEADSLVDGLDATGKDYSVDSECDQ